jgi:hypothetical protein
MRHILLGLLLSCACSQPLMAWSGEDLTSSFAIKEQQCETKSCFDLLTDGNKIGALRRTPGTSGSFDYFDQNGQRQIILTFNKSYWGISQKFNVYDKNQQLIAKLTMDVNYKSGQLLSFTVLNPDESKILAIGRASLLGTSHSIYLGNSWDKLAIMTRPLFTWSRDSEVTILNKTAFVSGLGVDPNVLLASMSLYCIHDTTITKDAPQEKTQPKLFKELQAKLQKLVEEREGAVPINTITEAQMQAAADVLNQRYHEVFDDSHLNEEEKVKQWVTFGCDLIQAHTLAQEEEQALLQFMLKRLQS